MAEEQSEALTDSQKEGDGLNNLGGLIDQAGLARIFAGEGETEQEAKEPEPTQPVEQEAEREEEPENQPSSDGDGAGESENDLSHSDTEQVSEDGDKSDGLLKRISKLTAIRRQAEDRVTGLEGEVAELRGQLEDAKATPPPSPRSNGKYQDLTTVQAVDRKIQEAEEINDWAEMNPLGVIEGDKDYSTEDVARIKVNTRKAIREMKTRRESIQVESQNSVMVDDAFPYWKDRTSPMYQQAQEIIRNRPDIKHSPTWKMDVTMYQLGLMAFQELMDSKGKSKQARRAPAQPSSPAAAPKKSKAPTAREVFLKRGDRDSLTEALKEII
jgi:hypothetical protein